MLPWDWKPLQVSPRGKPFQNPASRSRRHPHLTGQCVRRAFPDPGPRVCLRHDVDKCHSVPVGQAAISDVLEDSTAQLEKASEFAHGFTPNCTLRAGSAEVSRSLSAGNRNPEKSQSASASNASAIRCRSTRVGSSHPLQRRFSLTGCRPTARANAIWLPNRVSIAAIRFIFMKSPRWKLSSGQDQ